MIKGEKGFLIIDLAVAVAILALIAGSAGMIITQLLQITRSSSDFSTATRQAQNLGYRLNQDLLMASTVTTSDDPGTADVEFAIIDWKDWLSGDMYEARYVWQDAGASLKRAIRRLSVHDKNGLETGSASTLVADSIYSISLLLQSGVTWKLNIEARSGDKSVTREYQVDMRVE